MAQGKAWTKEERDVIIQSLQDSLELGFSRNKACEMIGLAPSTLSNWIKEEPALGMKLQNWENANNRIAMKNIQQALIMELDEEDRRKEMTKWWAERKMRNEFATRQEVTGKDGAPVMSTEIKESFDDILDNL